MAIKERKQITGTTAQIDAYAGHEGQIVWDKEKKTFVGMSGTAGKNYPLAPKAYVDTQFLPLTGGNITGSLTLNNLGGIAQQASPAYEEIVVQSFDEANRWPGGLLACRGHSGSDEVQRGGFVLGARNKEGSSANYLLGTPAGYLQWQGNEVLRVTGSGNGWVRFYPNLQICFGIGTSMPSGGFTVTFGAPFSTVASITTSVMGGSNSAGASWSSVAEVINGFTCNIWILGNRALQPNVTASWLAIGYY